MTEFTSLKKWSGLDLKSVSNKLQMVIKSNKQTWCHKPSKSHLEMSSSQQIPAEDTCLKIRNDTNKCSVIYSCKIIISDQIIYPNKVINMKWDGYLQSQVKKFWVIGWYIVVSKKCYIKVEDTCLKRGFIHKHQ